MVATIFTSLAFLSSSVSMTNLSRLVAASLSSLALSSSVFMANLSCLLVTTFSSLKLLSNSLSSPRFHLLRVGRRCYSVVFCFLIFASYPQLASYPGSINGGGGRESLVTTVCACSKNSPIFWNLYISVIFPGYVTQ